MFWLPKTGRVFSVSSRFLMTIQCATGNIAWAMRLRVETQTGDVAVIIGLKYL
jgi:hypothetical protein